MVNELLENYENAFILVSHDIPFLNDVINVIYHVENATLTRYTGDYNQFQSMYEMRKKQEMLLLIVSNKKLTV